MNDNDHSWDLIESEQGNLPENDEAYNRKYEEWRRRDWVKWLSENLSFPFTVVRMEDEDDAYFEPGAAKAPFRLDHTMEIMGIEGEDGRCGVIMNAREKKHIGSVPLCDVEVTPKTDKNYWPVREYVIWDANRCSR